MDGLWSSCEITLAGLGGRGGARAGLSCQDDGLWSRDLFIWLLSYSAGTRRVRRASDRAISLQALSEDVRRAATLRPKIHNLLDSTRKPDLIREASQSPNTAELYSRYRIVPCHVMLTLKGVVSNAVLSIILFDTFWTKPLLILS